MKRFLISGASGFIGSALAASLEAEGHTVYKLVRHISKNNQEITWNPLKTGSIDLVQLEGFDAVFHLAGENIMGFWTPSKKEKIFNSRVEGTRQLADLLCTLKKPPSLFVCASATGYYGDRGDERLTEDSLKGRGFLSDVCAEWEQAAERVVKKGIRCVNLRTGLVVSKTGGALKQMLPVFKWGLGGRLGSGHQYMSWISLEDHIRILKYLIGKNELSGPINAVSPYPVTNKEWTKRLGECLNRPAILPIPAFLIKVLLGELGKEVLLSSAYVLPKKLQESGFDFLLPSLENALLHNIN